MEKKNTDREYLTRLEKLKEQSKQMQSPVPVSDRKPVPGCCFEREFQRW